MFLFKDKIYSDPKGRYFTGEYLDHNGQFDDKTLMWIRGGESVKVKLDDDVRYEFDSGKIINCNYSQLFADRDSLVLCNNIMRDFEHFELENGVEYDEDEDRYTEVFQYYIIDNNVARWLTDHTDELVWYDNELEVYVLGVTHYGTAWDYVCAKYKL